MQTARFCHRCGWDSRNAAAGPAVTVTAPRAYGRPAWKRRVMAAILACSAVLVLGFLLWPAGGTGPQLRPGVAAPDFTLATPAGETVTLSQFRGRPVVLNFWATWCPPCRNEMPALQSVWEQYRDQGLVVLGVNLDESAATIQAFTARVGVDFPTVIDRDLRVTERYQIIPLPTTFFIDADGVIRDRKEGEISLAEAELRVQRLLSGALVAP